MKVRLLMITLKPFLLEFSVSTANVLEPVTLRLVCRGSVDEKAKLFPFIVVQLRAFEFHVTQMQVTVSPGHTDCLSQVVEITSIKCQQCA